MILLALLAQAQAATIDCAEPLTQSAMTICATRDFERADAALNAQWTLTAAAMRDSDAPPGAVQDGRPGYFETLIEAQRAWRRYRDAHCASEGFYARGGSLEPMLVARCRARLTERRTEQLRELADWPR